MLIASLYIRQIQTSKRIRQQRRESVTPSLPKISEFPCFLSCETRSQKQRLPFLKKLARATADSHLEHIQDLHLESHDATVAAAKPARRAAPFPQFRGW
jgi:hypothetical protein